MGLETWDWFAIVMYFALLLAVAWWVILRRKDTADDYFLAGRNLGWWVVGASIFASNIGSEHLVGLAGSGCTDGVAMAHYELHAWCLLVLAWVFVPFYARSKVFTMPEFLERRFSPSSRWVLSIISLVGYVLTKIAVGVFAGGIVFRTLLPELQLDLGFVVMDSFWIGSFLVIILTGIYTVLGGLRAVVYTDAVQTVVLVVGSALVTIFGLQALGGWGQLRQICGSDMFNLWKPLIPEGVEGTWAPVLVTNAKDEIVRSIWAAFLKLSPVFIFIIPGMICFALAKSGKMAELQEALYTAGALDNEKCQAAFPLLVKHVLPVGVRGLVVAGLLAALMSSLSSVFNASSTLFTMDFYSKLAPGASQHKLVWMGRIATTVMVIIGLLWVPVIQGARGLYHYLQSVQGYLAPPIFVVFFLGIFSKRLNSKGCLAALVVGFLLGAFRLAVDTPVKLLEDFHYADGSFLWIVNNIYFQYYSLFIFIVCVIVMIAVSLWTSAPSYERLSGLTYSTVNEEHRRLSRGSWDWRDVVASVVVLVVILAAYLYFRG